MKIRSARRAALATFCVAAMVLAACGDDDDSTSTEPAATEAPSDTAASTAAPTDTAASTDAPAETTGSSGAEAPDGTDALGEEPSGEATGTPITIGVVYSETGRTGAAYQAADDVANAWADWVNSEEGGVNGHPITIAAGDSLSTGEGAAAAGREVVESDGAIAVIINDSTAENALTEYLAGQNVPYIGGSANGRPQDSAATQWPNIYFHQQPSSPTTSATTMFVAKLDGRENFGAMVCAEVPVCAEADALFSSLGPALGLNYVGLVTVGAADPSYQAPCLELIGKDTDALNLGLAPSTIHSVIDECSTQGYTGTYTSSYNSVLPSDVESIEGVRMIGGFNGFPWWADDPQVQQFRDAMEASGTTVDYNTPAATSTWSALELFRTTMNDSGPPADAEVTSQDIIDAYHGITDETLGGLLPQPITYVADGQQPLIKCFWPFVIEDGETTSLPTPDEESGNGADGDLKTICYDLGA